MRVEELKMYKEDELHSPLWTRDKQTRPRDVIENHKNISIDK